MIYNFLYRGENLVYKFRLYSRLAENNARVMSYSADFYAKKDLREACSQTQFLSFDQQLLHGMT